VLLYDHRGFGASGGEPAIKSILGFRRGVYLDAVQFATTLACIDPGRIALWGDSFSDRWRVWQTAIDSRVRAVVAQVPAFAKAAPPADPDWSAL